MLIGVNTLMTKQEKAAASILDSDDLLIHLDAHKSVSFENILEMVDFSNPHFIPNAVGQWLDTSNFGNHVSPHPDTPYPTYSDSHLGNRGGIFFEGGSSAAMNLENAAFTHDLVNSFEVFMVSRVDSNVPGQDRLLEIRGDGTQVILLKADQFDRGWFIRYDTGNVAELATNMNYGHTYIHNLINDNDQLTARLNNAVVATATLNPGGIMSEADAFVVGGFTGTSAARQYVGEILVFNRALTFTERESLYTSLYNKWLRTTGGGGPGEGEFYDIQQYKLTDMLDQQF